MLMARPGAHARMTNITWGDRGGRAFCEECLAYASDGFKLRMCLSCGYVGCAEGSANNHAAEHYAQTDHPIAAALGSQRPSRWSYPDQRSV